MPFTDEQKEWLKAPLSRQHVKARQQSGRTLSYVEGWHVIAEANRIFGFEAWTSDTVKVRCVTERERLVGAKQMPGWGVTYVAKVRITVYFDKGFTVRTGYGAGHGIDLDLGQAHESAIKEAETDARKRALMTFGNPFGLALYDKEQTNVADQPVEDNRDSRQLYIEKCEATIERLKERPNDLKMWWVSSVETKNRDDMLLPPDRLRLQGLVKSHLP